MKPMRIWLLAPLAALVAGCGGGTEAQPAELRLSSIASDVVLVNEDFDRASTEAHEGPGSSRVLVSLTPAGAKKFSQLLRDMAVEGKRLGKNQTATFLVGSRVVMEPTVDFHDPTFTDVGDEGVPGFSINAMSAGEAERLATKIRGDGSG
jgi:hypothetical protein